MQKLAYEIQIGSMTELSTMTTPPLTNIFGNSSP